MGDAERNVLLARVKIVPPKWTAPTAAVVEQLLSGDRQWGRHIASEAGLKTGTVHPILMRLEENGLATSEWETNVEPGRPRRRYYTITRRGRQWAAEQLLAHRADAPRNLRRIPGTLREHLT